MMKTLVKTLCLILILTCLFSTCSAENDNFRGLDIYDSVAAYFHCPVFTDNYLEENILITDREDAYALAEMYLMIEKEKGNIDEKFYLTTIGFDSQRQVWLFLMNDNPELEGALTEDSSAMAISAKTGGLQGYYLHFWHFDQADENRYIYIDKKGQY